MATPAQRYSDSALGGSTRTGSTGSVSFPAGGLREESAVTATVSGGTATFTLSGGPIEGGIAGTIASSSAGVSSWSYVTEAPWGNLTLSWASNTGTVAVAMMSWE